MSKGKWVRLTDPGLSQLRSAADEYGAGLIDKSHIPGFTAQLRALQNAEAALVRAAQGKEQPIDLTAAELRAVIVGAAQAEAGDMSEFSDGREINAFKRAMAKLRARLNEEEAPR